MVWLYYLLLFVLLLCGLYLNIVGLPGLWLMVAVHAVYGWMTGWDNFVGWHSLITLLVLAIAAEVVEFLAGAAGSSAAGGRRRGMVGAIIGGLAGAIFFTGLIPIPIVGTVIGVCVGTFLGAAAMEYHGKGFVHSYRVGVGAAKGRFWGIIAKTMFGILMMFVAMIAVLPVHWTTPVSIPSRLPTTTPATP